MRGVDLVGVSSAPAAASGGRAAGAAAPLGTARPGPAAPGEGVAGETSRVALCPQLLPSPAGGECAAEAGPQVEAHEASAAAAM